MTPVLQPAACQPGRQTGQRRGRRRDTQPRCGRRLGRRATGRRGRGRGRLRRRRRPRSAPLKQSRESALRCRLAWQCSPGWAWRSSRHSPAWEYRPLSARRLRARSRWPWPRSASKQRAPACASVPPRHAAWPCRPVPSRSDATAIWGLQAASDARGVAVASGVARPNRRRSAWVWHSGCRRA